MASQFQAQGGTPITTEMATVRKKERTNFLIQFS